MVKRYAIKSEFVFEDVWSRRVFMYEGVLQRFDEFITPFIGHSIRGLSNKRHVII